MPAPNDSLRVGCVKYLNARPLIHGWPGKVVLDHPAALCAQLAAGQLDIALVSSFEFLRNPIYRIVDGVSIASDGPVYSVILAYRGDIAEVEQVALDPAAETSVNLLRCLFAEKKLHPRFTTGSASSVAKKSGRLLIGDQAIRFRQTVPKSVELWDLGQEWKELMKLPFVYALWLVRPEVTEIGSVGEQLRALRDRNLRKIDELVAHKSEFGPTFCKRYYSENLRFTFGESEKQGLRAFQKLCEKHGLLPKREIALKTI